jgi:hypothetical protein
MMLFVFQTLEPIWWLAPIIGFSVLFAFLYYRRQPLDKPSYKILLIVLRTLGVASLLILLLEPILKFTQVKEEKPLVMVYNDVSESLIQDSARGAQLKSALNTLEGFDVQWNDFASNVVPSGDSLSLKKTNFQIINANIHALEKDNNIAAAIVLSDGIVNAGGSPIYPIHKTPIFTLGLGDPRSVPDVSVLNVLANSSVFKGNETLLESSIRLKQCKGFIVKVELFDGDQRIAQRNLLPASDNEVERIEFSLKPKGIGKHIYTVQATIKEKERNKSNNRKAVLINVEDNQKKVHILAHGAHPDIGAIKAALKPEKTFSVSMTAISEPIKPSDIYIVHGMPLTRLEMNYINKLMRSKAPFWCISTTQSRVAIWSSFSEGLQIQERGLFTNQSGASANRAFTEFFVSPKSWKQIEQFPPLTSPYIKVEAGVKLKTLFTQKIGNVRSDIPLWSLYEKEGQRTAWLFGEGIWRWRLADFRKNKSWDYADELIVKTVQYLSSSTTKNGFISYPSSALLDQGQPVILSAEFTDETGAKINEYPVSAIIEGENGFKKAIQFAPFQDIYRANIGSMPPGKYTYKATLERNESLKDQSFFVVQQSNSETEEREANHSLLKKWSNNSKGFFTTNADSLLLNIRNKVSVKSVLMTRNKSKSLLEFWPCLFFIVFCFSTEWFLRKYLGTY